MLGFYVRAAKLTGLVPGKEYDTSGFFGIALEHFALRAPFRRFGLYIQRYSLLCFRCKVDIRIGTSPPIISGPGPSKDPGELLFSRGTVTQTPPGEYYPFSTRQQIIKVIMSLEQAILQAVRALPYEKQQEILRHASRLREETGKKTPFRSVRGLWADLDISLSANEIEENQRQMWQNFPREDF